MSSDNMQMLIETLHLLEQETEIQNETSLPKTIIPLREDASYMRTIEEFLFNLNASDVGVEKFGPYTVHFEGFSDWCQQDATDRCHLPKEDPKHLATYDDIYDEVLRDFINREDGKMPIESGLTGDEEYPIYYAIFKEEGSLNSVIASPKQAKIADVQEAALAEEIIDEASPNTLEGSFTPDLVDSKKWLCDMLAKGLKGKNAGTIYVLGSWYGNMGIFLHEADIKFDKLVLVEPNEEYLRHSKKLLDKFNAEGKIVFLNQKAEDVVYEKPGVVINTSCNETGPVFLNKVPDNMLCLLQARNNNENTLFPTEAMEDFVDYFTLSKVYYTGDKYLEDPEINYVRYMKIGRK